MALPSAASGGMNRIEQQVDADQIFLSRADQIFLSRRKRGPFSLRSTNNGAVDLGLQNPSPALLLSMQNKFGEFWWRRIGFKDRWVQRYEACPDDIKQAAQASAESIILETDSILVVQRLAECRDLCALMDEMCPAAVAGNGPAVVSSPVAAAVATLSRRVVVDTPLAEALAVRRTGAPPGLCHEIAVSSLRHEIKSVTRYSSDDLFCYTREDVPGNHNYIAVGGVCLQRTGRMGDSLEPSDAGKLVIYGEEWMTPWTVLLCIIGAMNTMLMIVFLVVTPLRQGFGTRRKAFVFLLLNVVLEIVAIFVGWNVQHRWAMTWKKLLVRSDPFHALLTASRNDTMKVDLILGLEALGGLSSVVGLGIASGVPWEALLSAAFPVVCGVLAKLISNSEGFRTSLVVTAMAFYLLEFVFEIFVVFLLDDSVLGWVVIISCIAESASLIWLISTVFYAIYHVNVNSKNHDNVNSNDMLISEKAPARLRDGTLAALRIPDIPTTGLMGTAVLGSKILPGHFRPGAGAEIKANTTAYINRVARTEHTVSGWLSLAQCSASSTVNADALTPVPRAHVWLCNVVVVCGLAIPVIS